MAGAGLDDVGQKKPRNNRGFFIESQTLGGGVGGGCGLSRGFGRGLGRGLGAGLGAGGALVLFGLTLGGNGLLRADVARCRSTLLAIGAMAVFFARTAHGELHGKTRDVDRRTVVLAFLVGTLFAGAEFSVGELVGAEAVGRRSLRLEGTNGFAGVFAVSLGQTLSTSRQLDSEDGTTESTF